MNFDNCTNFFYLIYQPIVNLSMNGKIELQECEVLLRSNITNKFPEYEYSETLIDEANYEKFMNWFQAQLEEKLNESKDFTYSINFRADQWEFPASFKLLKALSSYSDRIIIEFTEQIPKLRLYPDFISIIKEVKEMGYRIALDDYKNGINSLQMLELLGDQIDRVKFSVEDLWRDEERISLSKLTKYSKTYQFQLVVEKIESVAISRELLKSGVSLQQGFLFGCDGLTENIKDLSIFPLDAENNDQFVMQVIQ